MVKTVRISDTTIRKRLGDFRETPSSQLTIDEFQTIDLEEEQDPPSFTAARRRAKQQLEELSKPEITSELQAFQNAINRALGIDPSTDLTTNALESTPVVVSENVTVNTTCKTPKDGTSTFVPPLCKGEERSTEKEGTYACLLFQVIPCCYLDLRLVCFVLFCFFCFVFFFFPKIPFPTKSASRVLFNSRS